MQDNVTQSDRDAAANWLQSIDDDGHEYPAIRSGESDGMDLVQAFVAHRLASTAQPEVKGLVEALGQAQADAHMLRHAIEAKDPTAELLIRVSDIEDRLYTALAAYREAQP